MHALDKVGHMIISEKNVVPLSKKTLCETLCILWAMDLLPEWLPLHMSNDKGFFQTSAPIASCV